MPTKNYHVYVLNDSSKYDKLRRVNDELGDGIDVTFGIKDDESEIQAIHFDKSKFTVKEAKKWLKDNDYSGGKFEPAQTEGKHYKDKKKKKSKGSYYFEGKEYAYRDFLEADIDIRVGNLLDFAKRHKKIAVHNYDEEEQKQIDLAYGRSIFVSEGANKNGLYFTRDGLLKARRSPVLKPVNLEHLQDFIVGVIYNADIVDQSTNETIPEENIHEQKNADDTITYVIKDSNGNVYDGKIDIATDFVIWKYLYAPLVKELMENQGEDINIRYHVSMEVLYSKFGYIFDLDEGSIVMANEDGNFDKYNQYVGATDEKGRMVHKVLFDFVFSGKGIVEHPANPRSHLLEIAKQDDDSNNIEMTVVDSQSGQDKLGSIYTHFSKDRNDNLEEEMDKEFLKRFEAAVNTMMAHKPDMEKSEAQIQVLKQEVSNVESDKKELKDKLEANKDKFDALQSDYDKAKSELEETQASLESTTKEKDEKIIDLESKLEEAKAELSKLNIERTGKERMEDLAKSGITFSDKRKDSVTDRVAKMSDEEYASYKEELLDIKGNSYDKEQPETSEDKNSGQASDKASDAGDASDSQEEQHAANAALMAFQDHASVGDANFSEADLQDAFKHMSTRSEDKPFGDQL